MKDKAFELVKQLNDLIKQDKQVKTCGIMFLGDNQFQVTINGNAPTAYVIDDYPDEGESGIEVIAPQDAFNDL